MLVITFFQSVVMLRYVGSGNIIFVVMDLCLYSWLERYLMSSFVRFINP